METTVTKLYCFFILLLFYSCANITENKELDVLDIYLEELNNHLKNDTLLLAKDNSNHLIFNRYKQFIKLNDSIKNKMPKTLKLVFSKNEEQNLINQTTEGQKWSFDKQWDFIKHKNNNTDQPILYVSKPVFSSNGEYCMIYSLSKRESHKNYYVPPIQIYKKTSNTWVKVYTIPSIMFINSITKELLKKLHDCIGNKNIYYNYDFNN
ncbi:hypothetical protein CW732_00690 [Olleya sp. Bg11-27]|nr:hypothetical protein CW732_00690 [Olleya sp. Bg11-27]